jgi:DNA-binding transcriptional regulator YiaG
VRVTDERERRPETPAEVDGTTGFFIALGRQLKVLRERKGITQKEFGDLVGYGPDAVSSMERGVRIPRRRCWRRAMNCSTPVGC